MFGGRVALSLTGNGSEGDGLLIDRTVFEMWDGISNSGQRWGEIGL